MTNTLFQEISQRNNLTHQILIPTASPTHKTGIRFKEKKWGNSWDCSKTILYACKWQTIKRSKSTHFIF